MKKSTKCKKIEKYLLNLIKEDRKETLEVMSRNTGININSFAVYVSRQKELKDIYKKCKIRKTTTGNRTLRKLKKVEEYLKNLIKEGRKETLYDISKNIGINVYTFKSYVYNNNELKKLYQKCKMRSRQKNASSMLDKWESGRFDKIQVSNISLTEEEELKNNIINFLEKNDYMTKDDILNKFNISVERLNSLKSRDSDFKKKFNKLSKTKTYVIEEKLKNILDNSPEKKTIKDLKSEADTNTGNIYIFLKNNEQYNEKIFRKGKRKNEKKD